MELTGEPDCLNTSLTSAGTSGQADQVSPGHFPKTRGAGQTRPPSDFQAPRCNTHTYPVRAMLGFETVSNAQVLTHLREYVKEYLSGGPGDSSNVFQHGARLLTGYPHRIPSPWILPWAKTPPAFSSFKVQLQPHLYPEVLLEPLPISASPPPLYSTLYFCSDTSHSLSFTTIHSTNLY